MNCKLGDSREFGEPGWQPDTIANAPTTDLVFKFVDGLLYEINASFGSFKFEGVKAAFILKFGKPQSSEVASYQNRFGAKYEGEVLFWKNGVTSLILAELSGELDTSRVTFTHDALSRRAKDRRNPKIKPGPDL